MVTRVALYARVSTDEGGQDPETQLVALREECQRMGMEISGEFVDLASAGDYVRRVSWGQLIERAARRGFDVLWVYRVDRAFRSVLEGAQYLQQFRAWGVGLRSISEPWIDTTTPWGEAMYHSTLVWAQLEKAIGQDRTRAGMRRAKIHGTRSGNPIGRPRNDVESAELLHAAFGAGIESLSGQAREVGLPRETYRRRMAEKGFRWDGKAGWKRQEDQDDNERTDQMLVEGMHGGPHA